MPGLSVKEILQILMPILNSASGHDGGGVRVREPIDIRLPGGRTAKIDAAVIVDDGIGISIIDDADPEHSLDVVLRIDRQITPNDFEAFGQSCGLHSGEEIKVGKLLGRALKKS